MITFDEEFIALDDEMFERFGTRIPLRQIPMSSTDEELRSLVRESLARGENLLPEYYHYGTSAEDKVY